MSITKRFLAALALMFAALNANATVVTYTDTVNGNGRFMSALGIIGDRSFTFTHDISDSGYSFANYNLTDASILVSLSDIPLIGGNETFSVKLGAGSTSQTFTGSGVSASGSDYLYALTVALGDLRPDGKINITLTATSGSFYFDQSVLTANAETRPVPEPASLALIGLGLGAMGLRRRRRTA